MKEELTKEYFDNIPTDRIVRGVVCLITDIVTQSTDPCTTCEILMSGVSERLRNDINLRQEVLEKSFTELRNKISPEERDSFDADADDVKLILACFLEELIHREPHPLIALANLMRKNGDEVKFMFVNSKSTNVDQVIKDEIDSGVHIIDLRNLPPTGGIN